jgi:hypothetical protein
MILLKLWLSGVLAGLVLCGLSVVLGGVVRIVRRITR